MSDAAQVRASSHTARPVHADSDVPRYRAAHSSVGDGNGHALCWRFASEWLKMTCSIAIRLPPVPARIHHQSKAGESADLRNRLTVTVVSTAVKPPRRRARDTTGKRKSRGGTRSAISPAVAVSSVEMTQPTGIPRG